MYIKCFKIKKQTRTIQNCDDVRESESRGKDSVKDDAFECSSKPIHSTVVVKDDVIFLILNKAAKVVVKTLLLRGRRAQEHFQTLVYHESDANARNHFVIFG